MDSGTAVPTGMFCAHKRLRTSCPECRPPPPPPAPPKEKRARPAAARAARDEDDDSPAAASAPRRRTRIKAPTRQEAENAEAWWVRKE